MAEFVRQAKQCTNLVKEDALLVHQSRLRPSKKCICYRI